MLKIGDKAPLFSLQNEINKIIKLEDYIGKYPIVIFFYPKDNSFLCTKQCVAISKNNNEFNKYNAVLLGISGDNSYSHAQFKIKNNLKITLLTDIDNKIRKLYQVPTLLFDTIPGRSTYIIDKNGYITGIINQNLHINRHISGSLNYLKLM